MKNACRRCFSLALALMLTLGALILPPAGAKAASDISGNSDSTRVFTVNVTGSGAYITLYSYKGEARVANYSVKSKLQGYKVEEHYGFYYVHVFSKNYSKMYYWVPSASWSLNLSGTDRKRTLEIKFPSSGTYQVCVEAMGAPDISSFWYYDQFHVWMRSATWKVDKEKNCTASYTPIPGLVGSSEVTVKCLAPNYRELASYHETISQSTTLYPPYFDGYTATTPSQHIVFNPFTGKCSPANFAFQYTKNQ